MWQLLSLVFFNISNPREGVGVGNLRVIQEEIIDKDQSWAFFDRAASGDQLLCGGVVVYTFPLGIFSSQGWVGSWFK